MPRLSWLQGEGLDGRRHLRKNTLKLEVCVQVKPLGKPQRLFYRLEERMADGQDEQDNQGGLAADLLGKLGGLTAGTPGLGAALMQPVTGAPIAPVTAATTPAVSGGGYATVSYYGGKDWNPAGHIGVSINGGPSYGLDPAPGMDLLALTSTVPGMVEPVDGSRKPLDQERIPASPTQLQQLQQ
jgi:hypothetical protein